MTITAKELAEWKASSLTTLEELDLIEEIERLRETLRSIHRLLSPGNRTFDELIRDAALADDLARAALSEED